MSSTAISAGLTPEIRKNSQKVVDKLPPLYDKMIIEKKKEGMRYEKDREAVWQCALCIPALEGQDQSQHNRRISSTVWVSLCAFLLYTSAVVPSEGI